MPPTPHPPLVSRIYRRLVLRPYWEWRRELRGRRHAMLPRVIETSIPKSGTHLLKGALTAVGYRHAAHQPVNPEVRLEFEAAEFERTLAGIKPGEFVTEHLRWKRELEDLLARLGYKTCFVYRDPRAVCVSFIHYHLSGAFAFGAHMRALPDMRTRILSVLDGIPDRCSEAGVGRAPLGELYDAFAPWRSSSGVFSASFDDLVGARGGGDDAVQLGAVRRLLAHLGIEADEARAREIAGRVFNPDSATFRKGSVDAWRGELSGDEIELLNSRLERQILEWGFRP